MGLSACLSPSFHKHLEFLATSASAQNGSWWRWTTNQSSADTVARRTIRPGTCSIRYNTGLGILAPGNRGHCKPCLVLLGLPIWRREVVGHLGKMVNCGGGVGIHTPGWARAYDILELLCTLESWSTHWNHQAAWKRGSSDGLGF